MCHQFLNDSVSSILHQDYRYVQGAIDTLSVWIPLADYSVDEGILSLIPGSHRSGLYPSDFNSDKSFCHNVGGLSLSDEPRHVRRGDCIIFDSLTVHGAHPNITNRMRLSVDCRYQRLTDLVSKAVMFAPFECIPSVNNSNPIQWSGDPTLDIPDSLRFCDPIPFENVEVKEASKLIMGD